MPRRRSSRRRASSILEVLDSEARIPYVQKLGAHYYNFWQDAAHPLGIWRRTTLAEYRKAHPKWETRARSRCALGGGRQALGLARRRLPANPRTSAACSRCRPAAATPTSCASSISSTRRSSKTASSCPKRRREVALDRRRPHLRRHRFRPGLDDEVELSAHREGMEARHAARGRDDRSTKCKDDDLARQRVRAIRRRASSAISSRARSISTRAKRSCAARMASSTKIDVPIDAIVDRASRVAADPAAHRLDRRRQDVSRPARCSPRSSTTSWPASATSSCCSRRPTQSSLDKLLVDAPSPAARICSTTSSARQEVLTPQCARRVETRAARRRAGAQHRRCGRRRCR